MCSSCHESRPGCTPGRELELTTSDLLPACLPFKAQQPAALRQPDRRRSVCTSSRQLRLWHSLIWHEASERSVVQVLSQGLVVEQQIGPADQQLHTNELPLRSELGEAM